MIENQVPIQIAGEHGSIQSMVILQPVHDGVRTAGVQTETFPQGCSEIPSNDVNHNVRKQRRVANVHRRDADGKEVAETAEDESYSGNVNLPKLDVPWVRDEDDAFLLRLFILKKRL